MSALSAEGRKRRIWSLRRRRPGGQAAKTPPFHGGNTGSIPVRVTTAFQKPFPYGGIAQPVERPPHTRKVTDSSSVVSTRKPPRLQPWGFSFA